MCKKKSALSTMLSFLLFFAALAAVGVFLYKKFVAKREQLESEDADQDFLEDENGDLVSEVETVSEIDGEDKES